MDNRLELYDSIEHLMKDCDITLRSFLAKLEDPELTDKEKVDSLRASITVILLER